MRKKKIKSCFGCVWCNFVENFLSDRKDNVQFMLLSESSAWKTTGKFV